MDSTQGFRALICFLTCNRNTRLRRYAPSYLEYCRRDRAFDFLVVLDSNDPTSVAFCGERSVPLLWSEAREGVKLAKNRALSRFPGYDCYFFIEDDAELLDLRVLREHVRVARIGGFDHLCLFERGGARGVLGERRVAGHSVVFARHGGAQLTFFTRDGLERVGGWHTAFAQYRRFGHTEHSYRFVHHGLAEAAFIVVETLADCILWHYPPPVTAPRGVVAASAASQLCELEEKLISDGLTFFPVQTLCAYHFNGMPLDGSRTSWVDELSFDRYPRLSRREKRLAWADHYVALARTQSGWRRWASLAKAASRDPRNLGIRHIVKQLLLADR